MYKWITDLKAEDDLMVKKRHDLNEAPLQKETDTIQYLSQSTQFTMTRQNRIIQHQNKWEETLRSNRRLRFTISTSI